MRYLGLKDKEGLIEEVIVYPLEIHKDERGFLIESLKNSWSEVFGEEKGFTQNYFSGTKSGVARDEDKWHVHPTKQEDRFVCVSGDIVVALFDPREESSTRGQLNLFMMGESNSDDNQFLLLIPKKVMHGFLVVSAKPAILTNFPTTLYDPAEEGRVEFKKAKAKFEDGQEFNWDIIRKEFGL